MSGPISFDRPAPPGDQFTPETHVGALLVMEVLEHVPPMQTKVSDKPQDAIRANVYVIAAPGVVAETFLNTLLFPRMLVSRLQQSVGRMVLGVLTGQPGVKRDGKNVPYDLDDPTPPMEQAAVAAMTQLRMQAPAQQAPPAQQWGQQPATAPAQQFGAPPQQPGGWQQPPAPQGPPPGRGQQQPQYQQPPVQQPQQYQQPPVQDPPQQQLPVPAEAGPWGAPAPQQDLPPWEQQAPPAQAPWGGQQ